MLRSTFQHLKGVGRKTERILWKKGILTWEDYEVTLQRQPSLFSGVLLNSPLRESRLAYDAGSLEYFAKTLSEFEVGRQ